MQEYEEQKQGVDMLHRTLAALCGVLVLSACSTLQPIRTLIQKGPDRLDCSPISKDGSVPAECDKQIIEFAQNYTLYFAEFDDQGRPYDDTQPNGQASKQIETFLTDVRRTVWTNPRGVSVVVFAHGWLHSAQTDDQNLKDFRRLLHQLREIEQDAFCKRKIMGLYVGWRGEGTKLGRHPYDTMTFWSRKFAAEQIATGSFQRIPATLRTIQSQYRAPAALRTFLGSNCARLKTTYVGHSFGGLIMMSSMSQNMVSELAEFQFRDATQTTCLDDGGERLASKPDELVVAINPAIEGGRFDALFRMASDPGMQASCYRSPKFLAITSKDD